MLTEPITIREARVEDKPFARAMIWEALLSSPVFLAHIGLETIQAHEEQYWAAWTPQSDPAFMAVDGGGRPLGVILLKPSDPARPSVGWRISMGVEAGARGQGVGRKLVERAIAFARADGKRFVNLLVDPTNQPALALYRRMGFVETDRQDQVIEMRLDLAS